MTRPRQQEMKGPDWSPEKTIRALSDQLRELQDNLKSKRYRDVEQREREWRQVTESIIRHGFGENSPKLREFSSAQIAGSPPMRIGRGGGGISEAEYQRSFDKRIERFEPVLKSAIRELQLELPEPEIKGSYEPGDEYAFYKDLKQIVTAAQREVMIADNYLNAEVFELYVDPIPSGVSVRIVTGDIRGNLEAVAKKYATRGGFELRRGKEVHDRVVFVDGRCWLIGHSIKDAAQKKPTYMVEFQDATTMQSIYENIWNRADSVVKS